MKKWEMALVVGMFEVVIGIVLLLWAFQAVEPINISFPTPSTVKAELETFFLGPLLFGLLLLGMGIGYLAITYTIYRLEKNIAQ